MTAPGGAVARLARLLALVPWLLARPGVSLPATAAEFGVSEEQLQRDLDLAFVCGLPGGFPDDLIDVRIEGDRVFVSNADTIARPLRLGPDEAAALLVGLRALADLPGPQDREVLERTVAKLERAAGDAADLAARVAVDVEVGAAAQSTMTALRTALASRLRLHLSYYVPARDEVTERDVDPMRLLVLGGHAYLEAWCRRAEGVRLFRVDRMGAAEVLADPAEVPRDAVGRDLGEGLLPPGAAAQLVTLDLDPAARWVADTFPCEEQGDLPGGALRVTLRVADPGWVRRLVLRLGGAARVADPPDLADDVGEAARRALTAYPEAH